MNETVWGMIGCGDVTEKKSGPGLYKANGSRLKGVYNRTEAKAHDWVQRHGYGQVYTTVEELLADEEITAVYIATTDHSPYCFFHIYPLFQFRVFMYTAYYTRP